ncbi:MAG: transcriptional regulator [Hadesarchaea archaeon]|nr:MAG: transcriptional regulator [Hadesarchaea archaeon]TDA35741.1 MAG: transcriptional regulator [Hadesarchaea archaeon]
MADQERERIAKQIAGDITLSDRPDEALKRWREVFNLSQKALAEALGVSPSQISDYESGRRKSPGVSTVKKIVEALLRLDEERGGKTLSALRRVLGVHFPSDVILGLKEFRRPIDGRTLSRTVRGRTVANPQLLSRSLFGFTVIDSYKAALKLSTEEFKQLYGLTSERALIFTGVTTGRTPMVAIKVIGITPGMVVLHGSLRRVDPLGVKLAQELRVPLVLSGLPSVEELLFRLNKLGEDLR